MDLKVSRCLPFFVLLLALFASQLSVNAQSVPCAAITRNPLVLEALLDSYSNDSEPDLHDGTINAAQLEHLQFGPIVIEPGDALYVEYRGKDFIVNADFASGDRTAFDSSPKGSYEQWRKGILPLDMFRAALNQRLVRLRATAKSPNQVLFRNVKIIRAGKPVFEFAKLASYGKPQVKTAVQRQLPCVGFDEAPGSGSATAASYSLPNPGPLRNFSGGLAQPMLPPFPMMMQSTTTSLGANHYKFTGKELDDETGLYNYGARYYGPSLGRFITPDWSAVPVPVPYADLSNPQTLNQYAYVGGNPASKADQDGHEGGYTYNRDGTMTAPVNAQTDGHPIRDTLLLGAATVTALAAPEAGPLVQSLIGLAGVTAPTTVPIAMDVIEGATPGAPGPKLPAASTLTKAEQLAVNAEKGAAWESKVGASLSKTDPATAKQVTMETQSGVRTRMDFVSKDANGNIVLTETKSSSAAPLTRNQTAAHPEIANTGATVVGQGKPGYPGGTQIPPTKVDVVRPQE